MIQAFFNHPRVRPQMWTFLSTAALMVAEVTLASLWYQALFRPRGAGFGAVLGILSVIFAASYGVTRLLSKLHWRMAYRQAALAAWVLIAVFASLKGLVFPRVDLSLLELVQSPLDFILYPDGDGVEFAHAIYVLVLIWRAAALTRGPVTLYGTQVSFQIGLIFLLLYGMMFALLFAGEATVGMYLFLFFGLTAMSLARIANLTDLRGGRMPRFGSGWMASILLASLTLVGLAILIGWLASGNAVFLLASVLVVILALLTALLLLVLSPLILILARFIPYLAELVRQIGERLRSLPISEQLQKLLAVFSEGLNKIVPVILAGRGIFLAAILVGLILIIVLALNLRHIFQRLAEEEEGSRAEPDEGEGLLKLLARRLRNSRRRLRSPAQVLAAARIRQIYRLLMLTCQKLGAPRPPSTTPLEFLPRLESLFPEEPGEVRAITGAYVKVRYGEYPETRAEVDAVEEAWKHVQRQARKALAAKK